jgi:hypothetical protein
MSYLRVMMIGPGAIGAVFAAATARCDRIGSASVMAAKAGRSIWSLSWRSAASIRSL